MNAISVRILPMSETEFDGFSAEEVQRQFFLKDLPLPPRCGRYQYRRAGLNAEPGTIVLFQYAAKIIACATLDPVERFDVAEGPYEGAVRAENDDDSHVSRKCASQAGSGQFSPWLGGGSAR